MKTDPRVDAYIAASAPFARPILEHIRARVRASCPAATETIKWGMPAFEYGGRQLAGMAAFKAHATFGFRGSGAPSTGREREAMGQYGRIETLADLPPDDAFDAAIRAQMALIDSGSRPARPPRAAKPEAQIPPVLRAALDADPVAAATFDERFAPSHRREYCEWIAEAKRDATRDARVRQTIAWLREGKQRNWKYMR